MDNRYFDNVIKEMQPFFDENGFNSTDVGCYKNDKKAVKINYDESKQMYLLSVADIEEGNIGEYSEINAWLFDDTQNAKDAVAVGIDFVGSLRKNMGIKIKRTTSGSDVELPSISKGGSVTITGFTKKMLDYFPNLKDSYKNDIAENGGNFLYLNFFGKYLVPQLKTVLSGGNKKQISKLYDILSDMYVKGDKDTVNAIIAVLAAAAYQDEKTLEGIKEMLSENSHFMSSVESFIPALSKSKKLMSALIK